VERREEAWGGAREDALLGALRLIRLALGRDQDMVAALRKSVQTGEIAFLWSACLSRCM
jgi:hypothetical protein